MNTKLLGAVCLSLAAALWGGTYVVSKHMLHTVPPFTLMWLRYLVAFLCLFIVMRSAKDKVERIDKRSWLLLAWIGFIGYFVSIALQFVGTKLSDAHTGALLTSATPAFVVVFARIILKEALTIRKVVSTIMATFGVIVVVGWNGGTAASITGMILLVGAAVTWALLSVYVKLASVTLSSLTITTYAIFFAWLFTTPMMVAEYITTNITFTMSMLPGIFYLGIASTAAAFFLWNKGMELMDAGIGSLFFFLQPLVGSLLGWLLLDETISISFFSGGVLILLGVLIATYVPQKTAPQKAEHV
ncbi:EamA family transporter [Ectobacillus antri]|jgi:drug/metabolite transporter (DMT)-like permease|uniref:EamA family transporter n=1 Tax=Ectobacillus antri TaxID=2486280 RepID=A0ABT6H4S1_9BACI|nr:MULTISPECIES: EamA family transporter [Ectobacillus]MDG4656943.1 EamA family transporter [Ectobacillus antri]MDG5754045.1 EamA family transporter [Ectobacillus antri]UOY93128.1 EamA family transporter [Ectobacillus sp. JY-23]